MSDFPPPMLTTDEAAIYVRAKSVHQFRREVHKGVWPPPLVYNSRPHRWSRAQLDGAMQGAAEEIDPALAAARKALGLDYDGER